MQSPFQHSSVKGRKIVHVDTSQFVWDETGLLDRRGERSRRLPVDRGGVPGLEHSLQQHHSLLDAVEKRQTKGLGQRPSHSRQSCAGQNHTVAIILFQHLRRMLPDLGKRFLRDRCQIHPKRVYLLALAAQTAAVQHIPRQAAFTARSGGKYAKSFAC